VSPFFSFPTLQSNSTPSSLPCCPLSVKNQVLRVEILALSRRYARSADPLLPFPVKCFVSLIFRGILSMFYLVERASFSRTFVAVGIPQDLRRPRPHLGSSFIFGWSSPHSPGAPPFSRNMMFCSGGGRGGIPHCRAFSHPWLSGPPLLNPRGLWFLS